MSSHMTAGRGGQELQAPAPTPPAEPTTGNPTWPLAMASPLMRITNAPSHDPQTFCTGGHDQGAPDCTRENPMRMAFITTIGMCSLVPALLALSPAAHGQSGAPTTSTAPPAQAPTTSGRYRSVCDLFLGQTPRLFVSASLSTRGSLDGCMGIARQHPQTGKADSMEAYIDANAPDSQRVLSSHYQESKRRFGEGFPNVQVTDLGSANCPGGEMFSLTYPHTDISYGMAYLPCHTHQVRAEATGAADLVGQLANIARQVAAMTPPRRP